MSSAQPGSIFASRYQLIELLGGGGHSEIYKARQLDGGKIVALKLISPMQHVDASSAKLDERFEQEGRLLSRLRCPYTITLYDYGKDEHGQAYMALEYIDGVTLGEHLRHRGALSVEQATDLLLQLLESLSEAHTHKILHRDIKPQNIMLVDRGERLEAKLLDFGIGKFSDTEHPEHRELTADDAIVGTPRYMSPEQIRSTALTASSDLYSLGIVAYEMLVGSNPIPKGPTFQIFAKQLSPKQFELTDLHSFVPAWLREVINALLRKDPAKRPATADEVIAALNNQRPEAAPKDALNPREQLERDAASRLGATIKHWKLVELLGVGGAAAIYRAVYHGSEEKYRGLEVALKMLHTERQRNEKIRARFIREAEITSALQHQNITEIFEIGESNSGELYIAMELLDGVPLGELITRRGKLSERALTTLATQLLDGLSVAHRAGVVHRDIKPDNIFVTSDRRIKLLDFGVASQETSAAQLTRDGTVLGTPAFMAPEQARGLLDMIKPHSDTFAIGALFYYALTGQLIHDAKNPEELIIFAATKQANSISRLRPDLSPELIALIDKALAWNPKKRFADAGEMASAFEHLGGPTRHTTAPEAAPKPAPPRRTSRVARDERDGAVDAASRWTSLFAKFERLLDRPHQPGTSSEISKLAARMRATAREHPDHATLTLRATSLTVSGHKIWYPSAPHDETLIALFDEGLRSIAISPTLDARDLSRLLILLAPLAETSPLERLIEFWSASPEAFTPTIARRALFSPPQQGHFERRLPEALRDARDYIEQLDQLDARREQLLEQDPPVESTPPEGMFGLLSQRELSALNSAMALSPGHDETLPHILAALLRANKSSSELRRTTATVSASILDELERDGPIEAMRMLARVLSTDPTTTLEGAFVGELLQPLIDALISHIGTRGELPPQALRPLNTILSRVTGDATPVVTSLYVAAQHDKPSVKLCYGFLRKHVDGNEGHIEALIQQVGAGHARLLIDLLQSHGSTAANEALARSTQAVTDDEIKLELLANQARQAPETAARQLFALLRGPKPALRLRALEEATKQRIPGLADLITRRVQDDSYYDLPPTEQRALLSALLHIEPPTGAAAGVYILSSHGLTANTKRDKVRLIALSLLAPHITNLAVRTAITSASKRRPWNSKDLQFAATRALADAEKRP